MRTRPLSLIALGLVLVAVDFRVVAVDVFPDLVGWLLAGTGAWRLGLQVPAVLALVAALASAPDLVAASHHEAIDPLTGRVVPEPPPGTAYDERLVFDRLEDARLVLALVAMAAGGWAVWAVLGILRDRARTSGDDQSARLLTALWWLVPFVWIAPYLGIAVVQGLGDDGFDPVWNGAYEFPAVAGLFVVAGVVWAFVSTSNRRWAATSAGSDAPWAERMARPGTDLA